MSSKGRSSFRNWVEFIPALLLLKLLGVLPRVVATLAGRVVGRAVYYVVGRLRRTAHENLVMALPELSIKERRAIIKGVYRSLGRLLGEFSQFPKLTRDNLTELVAYEGYDNYQRAAEKGRGVLFLTGHLGAWELCAFAHGMFGHRLSFLVRPMDNPLLERLATSYRQLSGNRVIDKDKAVRPVLQSLGRGEAVGLLIDVNVLADQGVFCDFFSIPACSTTGLAIFALRSGSPVVPGFLIWDERAGRHKLYFEPEVPLVRTGDFREEVALNTQRFTAIIEGYVRRYPDQWLWIHRRWKTRPEGGVDLHAANAAQQGERPPAGFEVGTGPA